MKKAVVIGSGFAGMSSATFLANAGWEVVVLEKLEAPGGRGRQLVANGFTFDMGPSWYWMPDIFEHYFNSFGKSVSEYYNLIRLDPGYAVYWEKGKTDVPAEYTDLKQIFESIEKGAGEKLDEFMKEAAYKYETGMHKLVYKPGQSFSEFVDWDIVKGVMKLDVFTSMKKHVRKFFTNPALIQLLEFPVLFLGALPKDIPALYSLMNYADLKLGTWYPDGGMHKIVEAMYALAKEKGVSFYFHHNVTKVNINNKLINSVTTITNGEERIFDADVVIGAADYHFIETKLLPDQYRTYNENYWKTKTMAPSCIIYYVGINKKLNSIKHHNLFFDVDFDTHADEIYSSPQWPSNPLFYVSATSVTDKTVAPPGCENLFFLVPVAAGLTGDTEELRNSYFEKILTRFEEKIGESVRAFIVYKQSYAVQNFKDDYNAYKGNAYGLANTLFQTAVFKPSLKSKKVKNLYFTGQLTVPGPGVPPSLISGEVVATEIIKHFT